MDRSPRHVPPTVILPLPSYFPTLLCSRLVLLFTRILEEVNFDDDKHFGLVYIGVRSVKENQTVASKWEATSALIFTIHGISFYRLSTMFKHSYIYRVYTKEW
jgi:hypothetical protein